MGTGSMEHLSECMSCLLDELGFSEKRISERIHTVNKCSRAKNISTKRLLNRNDVEKIFVGSQREGIGYDYLNDLDVLQIDHGVICQKNFRTSPEDGSSDRVVFQMEQKNVPPGYCYLKLIQKNVQSAGFARVKYAVQRRKKQKYLSSEVFMTRNDDVFTLGNGFLSRHTHYKPRHGPSIPKYYEENFLTKSVRSQYNLEDTEIDFVRAFPCTANYMLQEWRNRERSSGWPSNDTIAHVMNLPAYVVPAGQEGSKNIDLQWRISFSMGELHLVQTFNNVQTKVFVLLKLIAKHELRPLSEVITSYVVKNVMLWLAEEIPQEDFCDRQLIQRLQDTLKYLKRSIQNACLPCYMLPERNLFAGKLSKEDQCLVLEKLNFMLADGSELVRSYIKNSSAKSEALYKVYTSLCAASILDKYNTCRSGLLSSEKLAEYYVKMFLSKYWLSLFFYSIVFHGVPFFSMEEETEQLDLKIVKSLQLTNPKPDTSDDNRWFSHLIPILICCLLMDSGGFLVNIPGLVMYLSIICSNTTFIALMVLRMALHLLTEYKKKTSIRKTFLQIYEKNVKVNTYIPKRLYIFDVIIYIEPYWLNVAIILNAVILYLERHCNYPVHFLSVVLMTFHPKFLILGHLWKSVSQDDLTKGICTRRNII